MKSRKFSKILVLTGIIAAMTVSMIGCGSENADEIDPEYVAQLEQECVDLRN